MYNNRHVRMLLSLVQMAWDSVEGSGVLAPPLQESFPPTLLQAGLGDPIVTTQAAEGLARAYNAMLLPDNPRQDVYEIPIPLHVDPNEVYLSMDGVDNTIGDDAMIIGHNANDGTSPPSSVVLTEVLYQEEYEALPTRDILPPPNWVHLCTRLDAALQRQLTEFINTGRILMICSNVGEDGCIRARADCIG
jgi:hypothetical protein